ncbi:EAL domain-containing protein (putative c-di-GMP-specific phosphodiesterase class I) [Panacagrimonas perspica]|uniref:EAL domain-containing protein (Putative c-di-GMP-specific phosphodiesterase class I) n=1 Tax=Panacagrimonas perspica TaxID=381431 RepID=A0A4V6Q4A1_9GAMM|nr:EAL domain-containing response regulator [Panacagrimonas perspica]TDU28396.1 EAL domain-containing protein (putative c-di-GMP-specific phosphodiesterase class I) [Panacagrimonas perspica]THD01188.1 hypothetical protein B1810_20810 [Panacagrimonas perspica]
MPARRVLLIEDDEVVRQQLVKHLHGLDRRLVDEAADVGTARRALEGPVRYDLIVADLMLPGGDTAELLRTAASHQACAGLILVSGLGEGLLRSVAVLCRERGQHVLGALIKPVRPDVLRQLVGESSRSTRIPPKFSRGATIADVERALQARGIDVLVQPKISAADRKLQGVEVLADWNDPSLGPVAAPRLAAVAADGGIAGALTQYIIGLALRTCADWRAQGREIPVSVNIGNGVLEDRKFPDFVERTLRSLLVPAEMLTLEIGEHPHLDDTDTLEVLTRLRMRGVGIALDNFGRGQTSALRVQRLPVSELKIDRAIVRGLPHGAIGYAVVEYAVRLARELGMTTTAVGVENEEQATVLTSAGCTDLQGHWVGTPMRPEQLLAWTKARPPLGEPASTHDAGQCQLPAAAPDSCPRQETALA